MGELAMGPVNGPPRLGDGEDRVDLLLEEPVDGVAARGPVRQRAQFPAAGPPPVDPVIGDLPEAADPGVVEPGGDGFVDGLENVLLDLGGDSRRERSAQPQPDFPRITASSMACAVIAWVNWAISAWAASSCQSRSFAGRPGARDRAANAASFTVRRIPMIVETSTVHFRAASAWVISPAATCKKISHFVSAESFFGGRRRLASVMTGSSQQGRGDNQPWVISRRTLRAEVRRKPGALSSFSHQTSD